MKKKTVTMHNLKITIDPPRCGPAIGEALLLSVLPLPPGVAWGEFERRQKRLKAALKKAVMEIEDMGPVKKKRE